MPAGVEDVAREAADELWVLSQSHVTQLITRGVPHERLHIMPLAIDTSRFGPHVSPAALPLSARCQFRVLSLIEARWGSGASALIRAFSTAFGSGEHPDTGACLVMLDTTRNAPFDFFRSLVLEVARAAGLRSDMYDNVLVAHADPADPAVHPSRLLCAADVVMVPTRDGVVGTVVMEAMASGKVCFECVYLLLLLLLFMSLFVAAGGELLLLVEVVVLVLLMLNVVAACVYHTVG